MSSIRYVYYICRPSTVRGPDYINWKYVIIFLAINIISFCFRYYLKVTRSNDEGDINMTALRYKSISGIWLISLILLCFHIVSIFLIPTYLHLVTKWLTSGLGLLPVLISTIVYYNMRRNFRQNQVHSIAGENDLRRIEILQSGHLPYLRREAENIFAGKNKVNIIASRYN